MMRFHFVLCTLVCFSVMLITPCITARDKDWGDVIVVKEGMPVTLPCSEWPLNNSVRLNWMVMPEGVNHWSLVLSAASGQQFLGGASREGVRLAKQDFQKTGDFSLSFIARATNEGRYSCLMKQGQRTLRERIVLLALIKMSVVPSVPVPNSSVVRLIAQVSPLYAVAEATWLSPAGLPLRSLWSRGMVLTKLPHVTRTDQGTYQCSVRSHGNSSTPVSLHEVVVEVHLTRLANFSNLHEPWVHRAGLSRSVLPLSCAPVLGDYVLLYWQHPDSTDMERVFQYDRWRNKTQTWPGPSLRLAGPASVAASGNFSFLLTPEPKQGGVYLCEVFLNENVFSQSTQVSVLHVYHKFTASALVLWCAYSERSQVRGARWTHQNQSRKLELNVLLGRIGTEVPLPLSSDTAGNYTCTMQLKNGHTVRAVNTVTLPLKARPCCATESTIQGMPDLRDPLLPPPENKPVSTPSLLPSLSALLLLVPLVAVAVGVLLWRRGRCIAHRGVEHSLSHYSGEVENIYEDPEDLRQTSPQGSVYMDLKPTGEDDVYKELDRYEQCSG